ncbi:MAG: dihydropteroate synthase [Mariprofundaceae bacterium]
MSDWLRQSGSDAWMMGVLNCTPDSFSDGGRFMNVDQAVKHGLAMQDAGAAIIDVGGESTRPGAEAVPLAKELERVIPVVRELVLQGCKVSIDTMKAEVMSEAIKAGACMINDVTALSADKSSLGVVADSGADVCLMHMQGSPESMQKQPSYQNVFEEVASFFEKRIQACVDAGIQKSSIILDPGIGFGKRLEDNLTLIANIEMFKQRFNLPLLLGVSRKSFLGMLTGAEVDNRDVETIAAVSVCAFSGADILRVHDVTHCKKAVCVASALRDAQAEL